MLMRSYADFVPTSVHQKIPSSKVNIQAHQPVAERLSTIQLLELFSSRLSLPEQDGKDIMSCLNASRLDLTSTNGAELEMEALAFQEAADDLEQIAGLRVTSRAEHTHEALRRFVGKAAKLLKPNGGVDIVSQDDLSGINVPG